MSPISPKPMLPFPRLLAPHCNRWRGEGRPTSTAHGFEPKTRGCMSCSDPLNTSNVSAAIHLDMPSANVPNPNSGGPTNPIGGVELKSRGVRLTVTSQWVKAHGTEVGAEFFLGDPRRRPTRTYSDQMRIVCLQYRLISL
ncbi:hypothetical protein KIN20_002033 [Parelaphostrongylus tenuis]|uniref:Uncharacterized protein n=1 Tax=Parelaphostrongylus tenuis TaxID=148309 RepID=A0AAD5MDL0_PARTN|nr:hypothetical protein KIN20_002033 [Parelaphostrongylus tenuis]